MVRRIALFVLSLFILLPVLFFVFVNFFPANTWLGRTLSDKFGRELTIDGPLSFSWHSGQPVIRARQIKLANMDNTEDRYMVEIDDFRMQFKFWPLLTGKVIIPELRLDKPKLVLEKDMAGTKNWQLPAFSGGNAAIKATLPQERKQFPSIENLTINDGVFLYKDPKAALDITLKLDNVSGDSSEKSDAIRMTGGGTLQGQKFDINASGGSIQSLRDNSKPFPLDLTLAMGQTTVDVHGTFDDPVSLKGINAKLTLSGANMADLFYLTSIPLPPTPSYKIEGQLVKNDELWSYNSFKGLVGGSDLSGNVAYDTSGERGYFTGEFVSKSMDVKDLGGFIGQSPSTPKKKATDRVLPDVALNLSRLRATDMDVDFKVGKLKAPSIPFKSMDLHFNLREGLMKIEPMKLALADGTISGKLILDGREDVAKVDMDLDLSHVQLQRFFDGSRFAESTNGLIGGRINLKGSGLSLADVLAESDGRISMAMSGGRISLLLIEAMDLDIAEALPLYLDNKEKSTQIRCMVTDFGVANGRLKSNVFVLDTHDSNIQGNVAINLKNETINGTIDAASKDGSALSLQTPIRITGKLKKPSVSIDLAEAGARGGSAGLLGALLTPLAAILPFIETGEGKDSDCRALLSKI